jgi:hypothetical protein
MKEKKILEHRITIFFDMGNLYSKNGNFILLICTRIQSVIRNSHAQEGDATVHGHINSAKSSNNVVAVSFPPNRKYKFTVYTFSKNNPE